MRRLLLILLLGGIILPGLTQNSVEGIIDPAEVRFIKEPRLPVARRQHDLRQLPFWQNFIDEHGTWYVHYDEQSGLPVRAFGKPIAVSPSSPQDMALSFIANELSAFNLPADELVALPSGPMQGKYTWVNFRQEHEGLQVLGSRMTVKFYGNQVVLFGCEVHPDIAVNTVPLVAAEEASATAQLGLQGEIVGIENADELRILPIPGDASYQFHLVYEFRVRTSSSTGIPARYYTLVDAHTGEILYRANEIVHVCGRSCGGPHHPSHPPVLDVDASVTGDHHAISPWVPAVNGGMPNISVTVSGTEYFADENGDVSLPVNPGSVAQVRLMGPWARIYSNNTTPQTSFTLQAGSNDLSMNSAANIKERSTYVSMNDIHAHMKTWMPSFDGLDFQLPGNIDVDGECNAFYDGSSVNFFDIGGGCNATSLIADVVYHEYGHGINDYFYQSLGGAFINGAMGEGYADYWAISLTNNPVLGSGFYTDNEDGIRRYDIDPKVYPIDLIGEVHADGEIIMGAWYDTHLLMGGDWNETMPLFVEAYSGLQATTFNGNEGVAYTNVLIDALQADDNDGDITNGTPNGDAIVEGFYIHGITLISNAELSHETFEFALAGEDMELEAELDLQFPFTQYLDEVECSYRINTGEWQTIPMADQGNDIYAATIPQQGPGTVVSYYVNTRDLNGSLAAELPVGAAQNPYPNLPFIILVGVQQVGIQDCDDNEDWGGWTTGLFADNANTGEWELEVPMPSYTVDVNPGTVVQPGTQVTPGGEYCFVTGNASSTSAGIGENDVDAGHTTLQSPIIDMSEYNQPVIAYHRWYTNSPPGGANPGADWWQVQMSNDGGQSWVYIENNMTSDMSWRRNAFRVSDYLDPTDEMRFRFIASDSTRLGQNLDGGSLVEAAMDDFILYDEVVVSVEEEELIAQGIAAWPNPVTGNEIELSFITRNGSRMVINVYNEAGQLVFTQAMGEVPSGLVRRRLTIPDLASGVYLIEITGGETLTTRFVRE